MGLWHLQELYMIFQPKIPWGSHYIICISTANLGPEISKEPVLEILMYMRKESSEKKI